MRPAAVSSEEWIASVRLAEVVRGVGEEYRLEAWESADVEQEVRIALWQQRFANEIPVAWIVSVAHHKSIDLVRRRIRWRQQDQTLAALLPQLVPSPELQLLLKVDAEALPSRCRAYFELRYRLGLTEREVANSLNLCRSSVRWLDRLCRRRLG
jgi:DNA-directed RNA polymerase specialized sigma24 family protein